MMYFWGIHLRIDQGRGIFARIEKCQKNLRHHYRLEGVEIWEGQSAAAIVEKLLAFQQDKNYAVRKRLYSQDRRPTRSVLTPPQMVICFPPGVDGDVSSELRRRGGAAEAIFPVAEDNWRKVEFGRAQGNDYFVPPKNLLECLSRVMKEGRLSCDETCGRFLPKDFLDSTASFETSCLYLPKDATPDNRLDILPAIAAPIWFRETVPYRRSYCSR